MTFTREDYDKAAAVVKSRTDLQPEYGLVLGSGLGRLADELEERVVIAYDDIPGWPVSTVFGHSGNLIVGKLEGKVVVTQQGRAHYYEGYTPQQITFPIRVMNALGVRTLILTNAAGGLNQAYSQGDIMLINDHINFMGFGGQSPLVGPNDDSLGERFVSVVQTYDADLRKLAHQIARENDFALQEGVYVCVAGPQFESPAEIRALRVLGGDAVGMSTVHEVLVARHAGLRVLAFSSITNIAIDSIDSGLETDHEEVLDVGAQIVPRLAKVVRGVLRNL